MMSTVQLITVNSFIEMNFIQLEELLVKHSAFFRIQDGSVSHFEF